MKALLLVTGLLLSAASALTSDELSRLLEQHLTTSKLPAIGAMVFNDDRVLAAAVRGLRKRGGTEPAMLTDYWHLGSLTKSMTASLAAMLMQDGKLRWDTALGTLLPQIHADYQAVTVQQLMEHRAGMSHDGSRTLWNKFTQRSGSAQETRAWWGLENLALPAPKPLGQYQYSNLGFAVVGYLLEKQTATPWETLLEQRLWTPLGITSGGFGMAATPGKEDQPWGHDGQGQPIPPGPGDDNPRGLGPAGTVHLSLADYVKYAQWHLTCGRSHPGLLPAAAFLKMHTAQAPPLGDTPMYEAGWMIVPRPWAGGMALTHTGTNNMNYAVVWLAPARHGGMVLVTNQGGEPAGQSLDKIAGAILDKDPWGTAKR